MRNELPLLTVDDYWCKSGLALSSELIQGVVVDSLPNDAEHGRIVLRLGAKLLAWVEQANAGYIGTKAGYLLETSPDTVRGPDLSSVRKDRSPVTGIPKAFWRLAPDVAIECVSPNEVASEVREKVRDNLNASTLLVWLIYPNTREVAVHSPDGSSQNYGEHEVLEFPAVMPGFRCSLNEVS